MWSFGCILYELYAGYPLFPGEDEKEHMALMMEVKGIPPRSVLARATRRKVFFDDDYQPIIVPNSKGKVRVPNSKPLSSILNCNDPDFVDFIDVRLNWLLTFIEMCWMENRHKTYPGSSVFPPIHFKSGKRVEVHEDGHCWCRYRRPSCWSYSIKQQRQSQRKCEWNLTKTKR